MYQGYDIVGRLLSALRAIAISTFEGRIAQSAGIGACRIAQPPQGDAVRMESSREPIPEIIKRLSTVFEIDPWQIFPVADQ